MDEGNSEEMVPEWKTPNSSEFGSLENNCVKRLELEAREELINQIDNLEVNTKKCTNAHGDGNDSGVDTGATNPIQLQRALSNNSAGYASSSGGLDMQFASCNSSLLSVCSDSHEDKTTVLSCKGSIDCTSENGSESSSLSGDKQRLRPTPPKKRIPLTESNESKSSRCSSDGSANKNRARADSANRVMSHRSIGAPTLATTERARSRDKQITSNSQSSPTKRVKPGTLPTSGKDCTPNQPKSSTLRRSVSVSRRTPVSTPSTEDGRWPSNQLRSTTKVQPRCANDSLVIKTKVGPMVLENKFDRFSTMSRRKKVKSEEDLSEWRSNRSSSTTRDHMTSSTIVRRLSTRECPGKGAPSFPPRYQKATSKTRIYHEASIQTALTCQDIDDAFSGNPKDIQIDAITKIHRGSQVNIRDREIEILEEKIKQMTAENKTLRQSLIEQSQLLTTMENQLGRERDEKTAMKKELQSNTERVLGMLELVHAPSTTTEPDATCDSLLMLESQIQMSGHVLEEKQSEINTLRQFCNQLKTEMNRSIQVQQNLLAEKKCFEKETSELQDFLQDEKTAIFEALKDAEGEIEQIEEKLKQKEQEVERLQDECRHLVRISEQRRQEFLGMQSKYATLESKSGILVKQQNHSVSGATLALSDLGSRLNDLVKQLVATYNISEQELEDVIYHNEAYSEESTPESERNGIFNGSSSPLRHHSFIAAVINAIKSAATSAKDKVNNRVIKSHSISHENIEGIEMLDSETEPCLMMENVLEDVSMPDSHSQNLISSITLTSLRTLDENQGDSLTNLCEAIANRQKNEEQNILLMLNQSCHSEKDASGRETINLSSYEKFPVEILVDNVINVDNLVTKLLKVLRIIQIDNDNCIQQLINAKNFLQLNKEETMDNLNGAEELNLKLQNGLEKSTIQLINNCNELANSHTELKKNRLEINKRNEDNCHLSASCSENQLQSKTEDESFDQSIHEEMANKSMNTNSNENNAIKTNINGLGLNSNSQSNESDTRSQNDTITKAIETLNGIQSIVRQYPALADLQRDLEQMLPSDCNANVE